MCVYYIISVCYMLALLVSSYIVLYGRIRAVLQADPLACPINCVALVYRYMLFVLSRVDVVRELRTGIGNCVSLDC